ncbi:hypothetical protein BGZ57DRAFT_858561 [Hyaloscypha finlandica]|nr:hypothetical protein BGZ57DRAFT_858561 [Hyaloscypha finlandica]
MFLLFQPQLRARGRDSVTLLATSCTSTGRQIHSPSTHSRFVPCNRMDDDRGRKRTSSGPHEYYGLHSSSRRTSRRTSRRIRPPHMPRSSRIPGPPYSRTSVSPPRFMPRNPPLPSPAEEENGYRGHRMMGTTVQDVPPFVPRRNTSNIPSSGTDMTTRSPGFGYVSSQMSAARSAEAGNNRRKMTAANARPVQAHRGSIWSPPSNARYPSSQKFPPSNLFGVEDTTLPPFGTATPSQPWNIPGVREVGLPPPSSISSNPSTLTLVPSSQYFQSTSSSRRSRTATSSETPRTPQTSFDEAISRRCTSRDLIHQRANASFDATLLTEPENPLNGSVLNSPFVPCFKNDPDASIACRVQTQSSIDERKSWEQMFPFLAENGEMTGEPTQQSFSPALHNETQVSVEGPDRRAEASYNRPVKMSPDSTQSRQDLPSPRRQFPVKDEDFRRSMDGFDNDVDVEEISVPQSYWFQGLAHSPPRQRASVAREQYLVPSFKRTQSEESSCTLRNSTLTPDPASQLLDGRVELVEWVPSQKHEQVMAMYEEAWDNESTAGTSPAASRKRKSEALDLSSDQEHSVEEKEVAETPSPKRRRLSWPSSWVGHIPETPTPSQNRARTSVPSSDVDDSDISDASPAIQSREFGPMNTYSSRKISLSEFREPPQLPEKPLSAILQARYGRSTTTTPTRSIQTSVEQLASSTQFSDERFQKSFDVAFDNWMSQHGKNIVQRGIEDAVNGMIDERMVKVDVPEEVKREKRYEEVTLIEDSQGYTDDDEL